jgi:hypothetical protein
MAVSTMREQIKYSSQGGTMSFNSYRGALSCAAAFFIFGCSASDSTVPDVRAVDGLRLLTVVGDAPALATTVTSFYAVRGKNAGVDLWYRPRPGRSDSTKFLEFRLAGSSLDRRPDGTAFAEGDSVRITLTVSDATHLIVDFQPSGLRFTTKDPGKLKMFFGECGDDLDRNGKVDSDDDAIQQQLSIWRQETPLTPWVKLSSVVVKNNKELDADIGGFTGYAAAY